MPDDTAQEPEQCPQAPRSLSLTDEDRRLLASLLDELVGNTKNGHPIPEPHDAEDFSHEGDGARTTRLASA
jgi:hypothetical protein